MFELLFKYPDATFRRGEFVLLAPLPMWALASAVLAAALLLAWQARRCGGALARGRRAAVWLLQTAMIALVLLLLWRPALSVATLRPQQNVVAVLVDDSRSMALREGGATRIEQARNTLSAGLLDGLRERFQVRLYRFGGALERIDGPERLGGGAPATHLAGALRQVVAESSMLPLGAVVVLTDGADNTGGIDRETVAELRRRRIPVHAIGFGRETPDRDVEVAGVSLPARALPGSRLSAQVTLRQYGLAGRPARVSVRDGTAVLAAREIRLAGDGALQSESLGFEAGAAGLRHLRVAVEPLEGEINRENNERAALVDVRDARPRILYVEGEPRWEFKFIRRAVEEDGTLGLASMLRTTENKIYRQGVQGPQELESGFPATAEDLFAYQGLVIGSVEAGYFTAAQQELIREFANRRGGGVLFLGGRFGLSDGGWQHSPVGEILPVRLPQAARTFHRDRAAALPSAAGISSPLCRLDEDPGRNAERWKKMPSLANYNEVGEPKPGAVVLLEGTPEGARRAPLLAVQNYGRGRTAVLATGGTWRWRMSQDHADRSHETFWRQVLRWLVNDTPGQVTGSTPQPVLSDEGRTELRAEVRDKAFRPRSDLQVEARVVGPDGGVTPVALRPQPSPEGMYAAEWDAPRPGSYVVEVVARRGGEEVGRDVFQFRREDGAAEAFATAQNRDLLEKLAEATGGRYYTPAGARRLPSGIVYSEAGITTREMKDLWNMPAVFLLALALRGSEWLLRRKWGGI